jgi:hypothetical protein
MSVRSGSSRARVWVAAIAVAGFIAVAAAPGSAASSFSGLKQRDGLVRLSQRELLSNAAGKVEEGEGGEARSEILDSAESFAAPRNLPAEFGDADVGAARLAAVRAASRLPVVGGNWNEITDLPYDSDDPNYRDPVISNSGGGSGIVTGRMSAIATDGARVYIGAADGGVWRSTDGGDTWTPLTDDLPTTSTGALAVNPDDHSVWLGTGEANTAFENYLGTGIYRSDDYGDSWIRVGGDQLRGTMVARIVMDGNGMVYAATSSGIFRRPADAPTSQAWDLVLLPGTPGPFGFTYSNDVQVMPGTDGDTVIANIAWRGGHTDYNGFYVSHKSGDAGTWNRVRPNGIDRRDIGRSSFAYAADGSKLYALVESIQNYNYNPETALMGIYVSDTGDVAGPWTLIADNVTLANSPGSALTLGDGYSPGIQAWYNQFIGVDPGDADHVYVGLEEVYETTDAGSSWTTIGPYWNFGLPCGTVDLDNCPKTTHPDQHAVAFDGSQVWVGNDGGVWSRDLVGATQWDNHNTGLDTLQYYYGGAGAVKGGLAFSGGLQDNGGSLLLPGADTMVSPFGGDGGDVIVSPTDGFKIVHEYTYNDMWLTTNGGQSDGSTNAWREISPSCYAFTYTPDPCDPNPRFIAPFDADPKAPDDHWVTGGQYVWEDTQGWDTTCDASACDWQIVHDTGDGNTTTAIAVSGDTIYAGWCGFGCNPSPYFSTGIDTNVGGHWHTVVGPDITNGGRTPPQRYVFNLVIDPRDDTHVYALYSGYSRRWIKKGGTGQVYESYNGGHKWANITGNLPDAPADDLVVVNGKLVVATDVGVFITDKSDPGSYSRYGLGLPGAIPNDLQLLPGRTRILASTHGRGMWTIRTP